MSWAVWCDECQGEVGFECHCEGATEAAEKLRAEFGPFDRIVLWAEKERDLRI